MKMYRRSFLKVAAGAVPVALATDLGIPAIVRAATPVKMTLPWLPLGTFSYAFVAKKMGFWEKRGLDVSIDRGFGSGKVCVPVDQGQYDFGILDLAVMMNCAARGLDLVAVAGVWPRSPVGIFSLKEYGSRQREISSAASRRACGRRGSSSTASCTRITG
jgi:NitT/TauT family transport system substrate-binding protein